jgi:putative nucleotidyltransferase with HDIG domain
MTQKDLIFLKNWFSTYCESFYSLNPEDQKNIFLKVKHSLNVCENIIQIAGGLSLNQNETMLAETIALFHDIGRFPQYAKYKTFNDSISVNHGKLGAEVLHEERPLQNLSEDEQKLIINTVKLHNTYAIPYLENSESSRTDTDQKNILFLKLIRDADKLDIWRVFIEYYESNEAERASVAAHGLPDLPEYSEKILSCIYEKKTASMRNVKTLNDFKLMHLSWIYDLNFNTSFRLLLERDYINKIITKLPQTDRIKKAFLLLHEFAYQKKN